MLFMAGTAVLLQAVEAAAASSGALPTEFDSRTKWPGCATRILNQGGCGSCWTFGSSEALSDRLCAGSGGKINVTLSPQELVSCDSAAAPTGEDGVGHGCAGGNVVQAWSWMTQHGMPTCGDPSCTSGCEPYLSGSGCDGANPDGNKLDGCHTCTANSTVCPGDGSPRKLYFATSFKRLGSVQEMMTELYVNGPITVGFDVFENFKSFFAANPTGVYNETVGRQVGAHGVKIIGWGVQDSIPYWTVANSWTAKWGDNGFFKFKRGVDLAKIESRAPVTGMPKLAAVDASYMPISSPLLVASAVVGGDVGGWHEHTNPNSSTFANRVASALLADSSSSYFATGKIQSILPQRASGVLLKRIHSLRTQVVAGLNVRIEVDLQTVVKLQTASAVQISRCSIAGFESLQSDRVRIESIQCDVWV